MFDNNFITKREAWLKKEVISLIHFKFFFKFHYQKLALFVLCIIASYMFFTAAILSETLGHLGSWSYLGVFLAGILFAFGFTSPFSAGLLLVMSPENIILAALIGGVGSLIGDMLIFRFVKVSFEKEFNRLKQERPFLFFKSQLEPRVSPQIWHYFVFALAGLFFAAPFIPDEAAVTLLAGLSNIDAKKIAIVSFVCNTIGIFILLSL